MNYPLPSYAASIWIVGDEVHLSFPSPGHARNHTVRFPATARGLELALKILRERERQDELAVIGSSAAPVQYDIEAMYRAISSSAPAKRLEVTRAEKVEAEEFLKELGL